MPPCPEKEEILFGPHRAYLPLIPLTGQGHFSLHLFIPDATSSAQNALSSLPLPLVRAILAFKLLSLHIFRSQPSREFKTSPQIFVREPLISVMCSSLFRLWPGPLHQAPSESIPQAFHPSCQSLLAGTCSSFGVPSLLSYQASTCLLSYTVM